MRLLLLTLVFLLGCTSTNTYRVRNYAESVGIAVSTESLISVIHPPFIGQELQVFIRGHWIPVRVTKIGYRGIIILRGIDENLDLQPGDSGSPVAIIIGKRKK